jgi:allophanate hydrolase
MSSPDTLLISSLLAGYRARQYTPAEVMERVLANIASAPDRRAWITLIPRERVLEYAAALATRDPAALPLYGVPFAIKDNIDLESVPTTAGCPDFAYTPARSAFVVEKLIAAGAIPIGKTNLDQFATGLVGTRSPYGAGRNSFDPDYISGGSSSGSAVAVAMGLVSFSLGTDTAGSGRVPAAFNNIVGLKATCGALSTSGVVPACRSLDCVSVFALTADDAARVFSVAAAFDPADAYSRALSDRVVGTSAVLRFGVPRTSELEFFGDAEYARLFTEAIDRLESLGGRRVEIDFEPFLATARLLYEGPWIAERYCAVGDFLERKPASVHPVTRSVIAGGRNASAADAFRAQYRLMELRRTSEQAWADMDVLLTPTAGTIHRIEAVEADPVRLNSELGYYTNFVNLLDLAAVAVPAGFRSDGLPFGVTLVGRAGSDKELLALAGRLHRATPVALGALDVSIPTAEESPAAAAAGDCILVAVCGAHMNGLPLNHQLTSRDAVLVSRTRTAPRYRFFALPGGPPHRPGLVKVAEGGAAIEVEVWSVPAERFGSFVAGIPAPLGIGRVELENGAQVSGFVCEAYATVGAADITAFGGWRSYLASESAQ